MGFKQVTPEEKAEFLSLIKEGWSTKDAAQKLNRSYGWAKKFLHDLKVSQPNIVLKPDLPEITGPKMLSELEPIARDCLEDFARFRGRFFGRISSPWQEDAADQMRKFLETPYEEYVVVNCPPGSGKSTLFTHDIPAWLTARSRTIRGFIGSSTGGRARDYTFRLRNTFARSVPVLAKREDLIRGLGHDADSTLTHDYGRFKPLDHHVPWSRESFIVEQIGETSTDEKESTWAAFGQDSEFLGYRVNIIVWDDLVTTDDNFNNIELIEKKQQWWHDEAETRLEPGGLLILQGQRLHTNDLYKYCLQLKSGIEDLDEHLVDLGQEQLPSAQKYHHIVYRAHYEDICKAKEDPSAHTISAAPYKKDGTGGCLLDPARLSWRKLRSVQARPFSNYRVVYQQEDVDPSGTLVPELWINGGTGDDGIEYPGCWDEDRALAQIPNPLPYGQRLSVVTVDPSPTRYWAVHWWLYVEPEYIDEPGMGYRYLLDLERKPMDANDLLDFNMDQGQWTGLLQDWHHRSKSLGFPFTHLIIEYNAAQRFLYQYDFFRRWLQIKSVNLTPHATSKNKADPEYGVKTIKTHYRYGRVRLPGYGFEARRQAQHLVNEVTTWPNGAYDDNVMAHWFLEYQLQFLVDQVDDMESIYDDIPSWVGDDPRLLAR